jgi:Tfp pilus assembly protein PilO
VRPLLPREQVLLWALGLVALVAAFAVFVYAPKTSEARALAAQLAAHHADADRLRQEARRQQELERDLGDLRKSVGAVEAKLPSAREIPPLILQLDELAGRSGVTVTSLKPGVLQPVTTPAVPRDASPHPSQASPRQTVKYQKLAIDLETRGTFSSTLDFVRGLETFPHALAISNLQLTQASTGSGGDPEDPVLTLGVTATVYVRPEGGDAP